MPGAITDLLTRATDSTTGRPVISALAGTGKAIGASSLTITDATNWTTNSVIYFTIYNTQVIGNIAVKDPSTQTDWKGTLAGTTISNLTLTGGTDRVYGAGAIVEQTPTARYAKDMYDNLTTHANQDGTLKTTAIPANSVGSSQIQSNAVDNSKISGVSSIKLTNPHKFRAYIGATQTVASNTFVKAGLNTENYDTSNNFDTTTFRFTAAVAGYYQFNGRIQSNGTQSRTIASLYKNGSEHSRGTDAIAAASAVGGSSVADVIALAVGEYVELFGFTSGTTFGVDGIQSCYLSGFLISQF